MKSVLVVDDEPVVRALVEASLGDAFRVTAVADGASAMNVLKKMPVDLVLLDVRLPGMSGREVARRLRSQATTASVPILLMSGVEPAEGSDADGVLRKPFTPAALRSVVADWLA